MLTLGVLVVFFSMLCCLYGLDPQKLFHGQKVFYDTAIATGNGAQGATDKVTSHGYHKM
jgi:hypothetical protein